MLFKIQCILKELGYHDINRISQEVLDFHKDTNKSLDDIFSDLNSNIPWEYIRGYTEFCNREFRVTKDILIPRIETEDMVKIGLDIFKQGYNNNHFKTIIDIGTGSGCIAISLNPGVQSFAIDKHFTLPRVYATDISKDVLDVAKRNAEINSVCNIEFVNTDLIRDLDIESPVLMLANLPYIPTNQYKELDPSVKDFEPRLALDGGENGLYLYKKLFKQIKDKDIKQIRLLIEIEPSTLSECISLIKNSFENSDIEIIKDYRDLDRFILISLD